jgi:hypothetical protein
LSNSPLFPSVGDDAKQQRLLAGVRELVQSVLVSLNIPKRLVTSQPFSVASGMIRAASWGTLNRINPPYDGLIALPRMRPDTVNVPVSVLKAVATGTMRIVTGGPGLDGKTPPRINGSPTGLLLATGFVGVRAFYPDGVDWWADGAK